jgi:hypothetical protein
VAFVGPGSTLAGIMMVITIALSHKEDSKGTCANEQEVDEHLQQHQHQQQQESQLAAAETSASSTEVVLSGEYAVRHWDIDTLTGQLWEA